MVTLYVIEKCYYLESFLKIFLSQNINIVSNEEQHIGHRESRAHITKFYLLC